MMSSDIIQQVQVRGANMLVWRGRWEGAVLVWRGRWERAVFTLVFASLCKGST